MGKNQVQPQDFDKSSHIIDDNIKSTNDLNQSKFSCRICLSSQKQTNVELISPCKCAGSLKYVHKSCYFEWIKHIYHRLQISSDKQKMQMQGFQCEICKGKVKAQLSFQRSCVTRLEFKQICRDSIPLTIVIIIFFMIAIAAFSYLVYFADLTKSQFDTDNGSQSHAFFTILSIIIIVILFGTGMFFFVTRYLWIETIHVVGIVNVNNSG